MAKQPTEEHHPIKFVKANVRIPLHVDGIISYPPMCIPTKKELADNEGHYLSMTPNVKRWDPLKSAFKDQECNMMDYNMNIKEHKTPENKLIRFLIDIKLQQKSKEAQRIQFQTPRISINQSQC